MPSFCWSRTLTSGLLLEMSDHYSGHRFFDQMPDHSGSLFLTLPFLSFLFISLHFHFRYANLMLGLSSFLGDLSSTPRIICFDYLASAAAHTLMFGTPLMHFLYKSHMFLPLLLMFIRFVRILCRDEQFWSNFQLVPSLKSNIDFSLSFKFV